jgi:hypothetical protein
VIERGHFRTSPKGVEKWFTDVPAARVAMEAGTHSIWISEQLQKLGRHVIVANLSETLKKAMIDPFKYKEQINRLAGEIRLHCSSQMTRASAFYRCIAAPRGGSNDLRRAASLGIAISFASARSQLLLNRAVWSCSVPPSRKQVP